MPGQRLLGDDVDLEERGTGIYLLALPVFTPTCQPAPLGLPQLVEASLHLSSVPRGPIMTAPMSSHVLRGKRVS